MLLGLDELHGAQRMCDLAAEAPFWLAHRYGNARLDHSLITVNMQASGELPFALSWNAAGEFEPARWRNASLPASVIEGNPLLGGTLQVAAEYLYASTDGREATPAPDLAAKLLRNDGAAIRAVVPANSRLWSQLAFLELPPTAGCEVRVMFGDPTVITVAVEALDERTAATWVDKAKELVAMVPQQCEGLAPELRQLTGIMLLRRALQTTTCTSKGTTATATIAVHGVTSTTMPEMCQAVLLRLL